MDAGHSKPNSNRGADAPDDLTALSHLERGTDGWHARMVDVGSKPETRRVAVARSRVRFPGPLAADLLAGRGPKGPLEEVARTAGVLGAKRTAELVPMCHSLGLDHVALDFSAPSPDVIEVRCEAACQGRTGVEMEALTGAAIAALTIYDMTTAVARGAKIGRTELVEKRGGASGLWRRDEPGPASA